MSEQTLLDTTGQAVATAMGMTDIAGANAASLALYNAVSNQHKSQSSTGASTTQSCTKMLSVASTHVKQQPLSHSLGVADKPAESMFSSLAGQKSSSSSGAITHVSSMFSPLSVGGTISYSLAQTQLRKQEAKVKKEAEERLLASKRLQSVGVSTCPDASQLGGSDSVIADDHDRLTTPISDRLSEPSAADHVTPTKGGGWFQKAFGFLCID